MADEHQQHDPEPQASDFEDYDQFVASRVDWRIRHPEAAQARPETPQQREERERWEWATDGQGNFKSLGHQLEAYREMPEIPDGAPNPYNYAPDTEDQFKADLTAYRQGRAVVQALQQSHAEAQQPRLAPWPDDPFAEQRRELTALSLDYGKQAIMCQDTGQLERAQAWRERQMQVERDLAKLPPTPAQVWAEEQEAQKHEGAVQRLLDPAEANSEIWDHPRMMSDAPIELARANATNRQGVVRLPEEIGGPFGTPAQVRPGTLIEFKLDPETFKAFKYQVYQGSSDPDSPQDADRIFRRAWSFLHQHGISTTGTRPLAARQTGEEAESKDKTPNLETMSTREFIKYRDEEEAKKRSPVRMFPERRK